MVSLRSRRNTAAVSQNKKSTTTTATTTSRSRGKEKEKSMEVEQKQSSPMPDKMTPEKETDALPPPVTPPAAADDDDGNNNNNNNEEQPDTTSPTPTPSPPPQKDQEENIEGIMKDEVNHDDNDDEATTHQTEPVSNRDEDKMEDEQPEDMDTSADNNTATAATPTPSAAIVTEEGNITTSTSPDNNSETMASSANDAALASGNENQDSAQNADTSLPESNVAQTSTTDAVDNTTTTTTANDETTTTTTTTTTRMTTRKRIATRKRRRYQRKQIPPGGFLDYYTTQYPNAFRPIKRYKLSEITREIIDHQLYDLGEPFVIEGCFLDGMLKGDGEANGLGSSRKTGVDATSEVQQSQEEDDASKNGEGYITQGYCIDNFMEDTGRMNRDAAVLTESPSKAQKQDEDNSDKSSTTQDAITSQSSAQDTTPSQSTPLIKKLDTPVKLFSLSYLDTFHSDMEIRPRDHHSYSDAEGWTLGKFVKYLRKKRSRDLIYAKDVPCPIDWRDRLFQHEQFPPVLVNRGKFDIMGHLPSHIRPITLMNYIGSSQTYTPAHIDVAGTLGHNIMVDSAPGAFSLWTVASRRDLAKVQELFRRHDADLIEDNRFMDLEHLTESDFQWHLFEQRKGDFIVLPGNCAHQVINYNGYTMKVAWNNLTPKALKDALATQNTYRIYRKDTVYRLKSIAYFTLKHMLEQYSSTDEFTANDVEDLCALIEVFSVVVRQEFISDDNFDEDRDVTIVTEDPHSNTCDHCRVDIFNRFYYSPSKDQDLCMNCASVYGRDYDDLQLRQFVKLSECKRMLAQAVTLYEEVKSHFPKEQRDKFARCDSTLRVEGQFLPSNEAYVREQMRKQDKKAYCHLGHMECEGNGIKCSECNEFMCFDCLNGMFSVDLVSAVQLTDFKCPKCSEVCLCTKCNPNPTEEFEARLRSVREARALTGYYDEGDEGSDKSRKRKRTEMEEGSLIIQPAKESTNPSEHPVPEAVSTTNNGDVVPSQHVHLSAQYTAMPAKRRRLISVEDGDNSVTIVSQMHRRMDMCRKCNKVIYDVELQCRKCLDFKVCLSCSELSSTAKLACPCSRDDSSHSFVVHCYVCSCCDQLIRGVVFAHGRISYCDACYHSTENEELISGKKFRAIIPHLDTTDNRPQLQDQANIYSIVAEDQRRVEGSTEQKEKEAE